MTTALFGHEVGRGAERAATSASIERALRAAARLDALAAGEPLVAIWRRHEAVVGAVASVRETGAEADVADVLRLWATGVASADGAAADVLARLEASQSRPRLRTLARLAAVIAPAPERDRATLIGVAERLATAAHGASASRASLSIDPASETATVDAFRSHDLGDVAQLTPLALRRAGLTSALLPSLTGRPRALVADLPPLERLARWADVLAQQAAAAEARLGELRRYVASVDDRLAGVRRPRALRRTILVCLEDGATWAAKLARRTNVDIANAWRMLEQAEALGLLMPMPGQRRSRGDARVLLAPPVARAAGLLATSGGRPVRRAARPAPATRPGGSGLSAALHEVDAAMAAADALLARSAAAEPPREG